MAKKTKKKSSAPAIPDLPMGDARPRELIVIAKADAGIRATPAGVASVTDANCAPLQKLVTDNQITLTPLFGNEETVLKEVAESTPAAGTEAESKLHLFYHVEAPDADLEALQEKLLANDLIEGAYIKPHGEPPVAPDLQPGEVSEVPGAEDVPAFPGNFTARQGYLDAAPGGIDARYAWTLSGGRGRGVRIIDLEWGWRLNHVDLRQNQSGIAAGTLSTNLRSVNHGTAVLGVYSADHNSFGVSGICPDAQASVVSFSLPWATAVRRAADRLRPGDIMLLEIHAAGPRFNYQRRNDQRGYIPIEFWPDSYEAIRYAVNKGVIVVSAAGNGAENLDDALYDARPTGFPSWWRNPFRRGTNDSGSIIVGAGAPPPGTHGRNNGADRSRLGFSNYGAAVDAQGWGREVTTAGYGDLFVDSDDRNNQDRWFTDRFSGTSSASPIVVGALGSVQGYLKARNRIPLTPSRARQLLRTTGSPQQDQPGRPRTQRIGNRPNLRQMIRSVARNNSWCGRQFTNRLEGNQTKRFFTFRWPAHWHVAWTVMPTTPRRGAPQIDCHVEVERSDDRYITYWIIAKNLTNQPVNIEGRYCVLGW